MPQPESLPSTKTFVSVSTSLPVTVDDGESNWLVSYADMMTLLMGFFVLLTAFSTPDPAKLERMKKAAAQSTKAEYVEPYGDLAESLRKVLKDLALEDQVKIEQTDDGISMVSGGTLFFDSASTELLPAAEALLLRVADVLVSQAKNCRVFVEGHTDDVPIATRVFPSNWELSANRASTVVRLLESRGFPHDQLRPLGYADTKPVIDTRGIASPSPDARARNRRIVIRAQRMLPARLK